MANTKISALTAVTTPASTDEFAVNQGGTTKKETRAQIHKLESGETLDTTAGSTELGTTLIGTTTPATGSPRLDVIGAGATSVIAIANVTTNATLKFGGLAVRHYTNTEEPFRLIAAAAATATNIVDIGGGSSDFNAATSIKLFTAANSTTVSGTLAADITGVGAASILRLRGDITIDEDLNHDGTNVGFYGTAPIAKQTGVAQTAAGLQTALVNLGLITAA